MVLLLITQANRGGLGKVTNFNQLSYNMVFGSVKKNFCFRFPNRFEQTIDKQKINSEFNKRKHAK